RQEDRVVTASAPAGTPNQTTTPRILVIDDDEAVRKVAERCLLYKGFSASSVSSGEEGISLVQRETFDCVVLDLTMPTLSGRETFLALRALDAELPILLASGGRNAHVDALL